MRVRMLGTGSADGWPNPFCSCASCASQRSIGSTRDCTAALVDQHILIDCGPTVPAAASRAGLDLGTVQHVLITHGHPDHLAPAFLLWRQWISGLPELHLWAPAHALALCSDWIAPGAPVRLHAIAPGDVLDLHMHPSDTQQWASGSQPSTGSGEPRYRVRVHAAAHGHGNGDVLADEALLFDLEAPDGSRLLYATDTGSLPERTMDALAGQGFDLLLVDATFGERADHGTGHLDLSTLPVVLQGLRETGALTTASDVVAVHLSHHNPPADALSEILASMGARIVDDLDLIDVPRGHPRLRHLVLGGARSGKSSHAEALAAQYGSVTYIATAAPQPDDAEWAERLRLHRDRRPAHWRTYETSDLPEALQQVATGEVALVDCIGMWLTAQLDASGAWTDDPGDRQTPLQARQQVLERAEELLAALDACKGSVILVSNEVGMDVVPATPSGRLFRDLLGTVNAKLASACEEVTLMVAGRPLPLPAPSVEGPDSSRRLGAR